VDCCRGATTHPYVRLLRHGCGYALANAGHDTRAIQDWLGHRSALHRAVAHKVSGLLALIVRAVY
jgi:integrase